MTMRRRASVGAMFAAAAVLIGTASAQQRGADVRVLSLPPESAIFAQRDMPGYALVVRNCSGCHSAQYVSTQPPSSPRAYWEATVKKMKSPFGAPFPDDDIPAMVDYLVRTYGAERPTP